MFPPKPSDIFSPEGECSEGLDAFRLFFKNIFMAFKRVPVTLGQQYNVGEKPTVILYFLYINGHADTFFFLTN